MRTGHRGTARASSPGGSIDARRPCPAWVGAAASLFPGLALVSLSLVMAGAGPAVASDRFPPGPTGTCTDTMSIHTLRTWLNSATPPCNAATVGTSAAPGDTVLGVGGIVIGFDEKPISFDTYLQMQVGGAQTGIDVFTGGVDFRSLYSLNRGDSVVVEYACVANFQGDIELLSPNLSSGSPNLVLRKVSSNNPLPPSFHGNTADFDQALTNPLFAQHMSELVTLDVPVRVARTANLSSNSMLVVSDAAVNDSVYIDGGRLTTVAVPSVGTLLASISGISNATSSGFRILLRDSTDIVAGPVDLASGASGSDTGGGQSFNETRGVDVSVQGTVAFAIGAMTLRGLSIDNPTAVVGARVYDSTTHALLSSGNVTVPGGSDETVTVPISTTLAAGGTYRLCFFVDAGGAGGSAVLFDPSPPGSGGFPYPASTGSLVVVQAYDSPSDGFPSTPNIYAPLMTLETPSLVGVPSPVPGRSGWALGTIRPNPLAAQGVVELDVPQRSRIELEEFSVSGKRMSKTEETLDPGPHSLPVAGQGMPPGVYFVRLRAYAETGALRFRSMQRFVVVARSTRD